VISDIVFDGNVSLHSFKIIFLQGIHGNTVGDEKTVTLDKKG
jgi:hypothetical protein